MRIFIVVCNQMKISFYIISIVFVLFTSIRVKGQLNETYRFKTYIMPRSVTTLKLNSDNTFTFLHLGPIFIDSSHGSYIKIKDTIVLHFMDTLVDLSDETNRISYMLDKGRSDSIRPLKLLRKGRWLYYLDPSSNRVQLVFIDNRKQKWRLKRVK